MHFFNIFFPMFYKNNPHKFFKVIGKKNLETFRLTHTISAPFTSFLMKNKGSYRSLILGVADLLMILMILSAYALKVLASLWNELGEFLYLTYYLLDILFQNLMKLKRLTFLTFCYCSPATPKSLKPGASQNDPKPAKTTPKIAKLP